MFTHTDLVIRFSGDMHVTLRRQAHGFLVSMGFQRIRIGKVMLSHYRGPRLTDVEAVELQYRLYAIAKSFGEEAFIYELMISSSPANIVYLRKSDI